MTSARPVLVPSAKPAVLQFDVTPDPAREWDDYVCAHPFGTPFHLTAWKDSIRETFGYQPMYVSVRRNGRLAGVTPLFLVKGLLTGKALISTPFAVYGGALADDEAIYSAIGEYLRGMGTRLGVQYVEMRNAHPGQVLGFSPAPRYVTFTQQIGPDQDAVLESIPRKTRRMVRKSMGQNLDVHVETADPRPFEDLYLTNLRRLGTPAFPSSHFRNLLKHFRGSIDIREYRSGDRLAAAVLTFYFRGQVMPYYGASEPTLNALAPNNFMYFDLMRWGGANGFHTFDFGRSKKEVGGSYDFKSHWGMTERDLPYEMLLVRRKELPNNSPANPLFRLPILLWQRLPLWLTRRLGPSLIRLVP
ncbi:MAG: FemAB family PEP-CTERM system-associated protein [Bryobacteraceae bacterium]|nr:FemAB family PEP-CTERM system-associated protein [Bryobacteraceae bacterium]